jgi:DDE family transposase
MTVGAARGASSPKPNRSRAKPAQTLYEELYCARRDMENRIKEQYALFAGRVSAATLRANQLRLYLSAAAYILLSGFRRLALCRDRVGAIPV